MKKLLNIALIFGALFLTSCANTDSPRNTTNTNLNENTATEKKPRETSFERHIKTKSENSFDDTYKALKKAIDSKEPLTIIAEVDHSANAKKAGMDLPPTKVIMFGNPKLGTPLMKAQRAIGIDLPQKILVYEDETGDVYVVYNDPKIIAENHRIKGQDEVLTKVTEALKGLAEAATKKGEK